MFDTETLKKTLLSAIPLSECKDGYVYFIGARNAGLGVFIEGQKGFLIRRQKFGSVYPFVEYHWDTGEPHGTAQAFAELCKADDSYKWNECYNKDFPNHQVCEYLARLEEKYDISFLISLRYAVKLGLTETYIDAFYSNKPEIAERLRKFRDEVGTEELEKIAKHLNRKD